MHLGAAQPFAHLGGVRVEGGDDLKTALGEAAVVAQGVAQVAGSDQSDVVLPVEAELAVDLLAQQLGVVADAPGPVRPHIGEVFAYLGGVDTGATGQFFRRDGDHPVVVGVHEGL